MISSFPKPRGRGGERAHQNMKNIQTPKKRIGRKTAIVFKVSVAVGCFSLSLSTNYRDLCINCFQCGPKKVCLFRQHLKNLCKRGRRQVAKKGCIEVVRCLVEMCPALPVASPQSTTLHSTGNTSVKKEVGHSNTRGTVRLCSIPGEILLLIVYISTSYVD